MRRNADEPIEQRHHASVEVGEGGAKYLLPCGYCLLENILDGKLHDPRVVRRQDSSEV